MIEIKRIAAEETHDIRHMVLRPGRPINECVFEGDTALQTFHLGAFMKQKIVGIASFMVDDHTKFNGKQIRLRGMAVLPKSQGQGIGRELVLHGEQLVKERDFDILWFNAREIALGFYKNLGYAIEGNAFDIATVGKHYVMFKRLTKLDEQMGIIDF